MLRNGILVRYISGQVVEDFKRDENKFSFREDSDVKWNAIGEIQNTFDGIPESTFIRYRVKILWNNNEDSSINIGVNDNNIEKLSVKDTEYYRELFSVECPTCKGSKLNQTLFPCMTCNETGKVSKQMRGIDIAKRKKP